MLILKNYWDLEALFKNLLKLPIKKHKSNTYLNPKAKERKPSELITQFTQIQDRWVRISTLRASEIEEKTKSHS